MNPADTAAQAGSPLRTASPRPTVDVPPADRPDVSVVLVTYGTGPIVIECLSALTATMSLPYEVIVVDNEHPTAPDRTMNHLLLDTCGVRITRPGSNLGFGGGCNRGVDLAHGRLVCLLNPDVMVTPGWFQPLADLVAAGAATIAAPVLVEPDGSMQSAGHHLWADGSTSPVTEAPPAGAPARADFASAACWLMTRSEFRRLGGFDPAYHPAYYEDADLALRAAQGGNGTMVVAESRVVHHHGGSTDTGIVPDTTPQRLQLLASWPGLATSQPARPG